MNDIALDLEKTFKEPEFNKKSKKKIVIFAHSFGGILAKTAINRIPEKYQKNIILVTMASPHTLKYANVDNITKKLKTPENIQNVKIFTFGGIFDVVVPAIYAHIEKTQKMDLQSEHLMFLYSKEIMNKVFENVFKK